MRRTPLRPGTKRLARTSAPKRGARIRASNPKRKAWKFVRNFLSEEFVRWSKRRACAFCGLDFGPRVTSHMNARGHGGCGGDWTRTVTACVGCDRKWARGRWTFLRSIGWTWADVEAAIAEHQAAWAAHCERMAA